MCGCGGGGGVMNLPRKEIKGGGDYLQNRIGGTNSLFAGKIERGGGGVMTFFKKENVRRGNDFFLQNRIGGANSLFAGKVGRGR
jgi:hypothetical protein